MAKKVIHLNPKKNSDGKSMLNKSELIYIDTYNKHEYDVEIIQVMKNGKVNGWKLSIFLYEDGDSKNRTEMPFYTFAGKIRIWKTLDKIFYFVDEICANANKIAIMYHKRSDISDKTNDLSTLDKSKIEIDSNN